MRRRTILASTASLALAGCLGGDDDQEDRTTNDDVDEQEGEDSEDQEDSASSEDIDEQDGQDSEDQEDSGDQERLEIDTENMYSLGEFAKYESVRIKAHIASTAESVEYRNPEAESIETWDPGENKIILKVDLTVQNLGSDELDYPSWDQIRLHTPEDVHEPRLETDSGVSVEEIQPQDFIVVWTESSGLDGDYPRGWSAVFVPESFEAGSYAVEWTLPDDSYFWRIDEFY